MSKSYLTAIVRNKLSAPAKELVRLKRIKGNVLDYGCGKGDDVKYLTEKGYCIKGYDPHWKKDTTPLKHKYDTILCTYVFCTIDENKRQEIIEALRPLRKKNGKIYITVRNDVKEDHISQTGSHQYAIKLNMPIIFKNSGFCIYEL